MKWAVFYSFIFFSLVLAAQTPFARARRMLQDGREPIKALTLLDSCLNKNYQNDSALYYKGMIYVKGNELRSAKKICAALLKSYPSFTEAHYLSGLISYSEEDYGRSIDEFNRVLKANPNNIKALFNRSLAFGVLEDYLSAIEDLGTCISIDPNYAMAHYSRGYWYEFTGNYIEAAKDYENSIRLDPQNYDAYYGLAYIYYNQKEPAKACEALDRAIAQGSQAAEELKNNFCR